MNVDTLINPFTVDSWAPHMTFCNILCPLWQCLPINRSILIQTLQITWRDWRPEWQIVVMADIHNIHSSKVYISPSLKKLCLPVAPRTRLYELVIASTEIGTIKHIPDIFLLFQIANSIDHPVPWFIPDLHILYTKWNLISLQVSIKYTNNQLVIYAREIKCY